MPGDGRIPPTAVLHVASGAVVNLDMAYAVKATIVADSRGRPAIRFDAQEIPQKGERRRKPRLSVAEGRVLEETAYRVTKHALRRFRERLNPAASEAAIRKLAADAKPPTDEEWEKISPDITNRSTIREDVRVLGSIVFILDRNIIVTCWRAGSH